ncbi:MAG: hypothetical protein H0W71_10075 [Sphingomonas sp.]|nr:hypothetical protein [Sphingomonas sp.]
MPNINEVKIESGSFGHNLKTAEPTHGLRFLDGTLQQAWLVVLSGAVNQTVEQHIEWRTVPSVTNGDGDIL